MSSLLGHQAFCAFFGGGRGGYQYLHIPFLGVALWYVVWWFLGLVLSCLIQTCWSVIFEKNRIGVRAVPR